MSNGGSRAISVTQDDVEEAGKLEEMIEALVSLLREPRELQITEGSQVGTPVIRSEQRLGINFERVDYPVRGVLITSMTLKSDTPGSRTLPRVTFASYSDFYAISFLSSLTCLPIPMKTLLLP
jgi:hypothetical protein